MKGVIYLVLSIFSFLASMIMLAIGLSNSRLTELRDFFFVPLPLALIFGFLGIKTLMKKN